MNLYTLHILGCICYSLILVNINDGHTKAILIFVLIENKIAINT